MSFDLTIEEIKAAYLSDHTQTHEESLRAVAVAQTAKIAREIREMVNGSDTALHQEHLG